MRVGDSSRSTAIPVERRRPRDHGWSPIRLTVLGDAALWARSTHSYSTGFDIIKDLLKPHYPRLVVSAPRGTLSIEERSRSTNRLFAKKLLFVDQGAKALVHSLKVTESDDRGKAKKPAGDSTSYLGEALDFAVGHLEPFTIRRSSYGVTVIS